jgi:hypothetical protein
VAPQASRTGTLSRSTLAASAAAGRGALGDAEFAAAGQVVTDGRRRCVSQGQAMAQASVVVISPPAGDAIARRAIARIEVPILCSFGERRSCTPRVADDGRRLQDRWSRPRPVVGPVCAAGRLRLQRFGEGLAAQVVHLGPYATEGPTIQRRHAFSPSRGTAGLAGTTSSS